MSDEYRIAVSRLMTDYECGEFDMFNLITSVYYGKQYYFLQDNGMVYSRDCHENMTFDEAVDEFLRRIDCY